MDKDLLLSHISAGHSTRMIAQVEGISQTTVNYWIKKHDLKTWFKTRSADYNCSKCKDADPANFYRSQRWLCKVCFNAYKIDLGKERRLKAVVALGGKCANPACGYDKFSCSLDIHHLDPKKKDPQFKSARYWSETRLFKELKKCVVLCKNCHAAVHAGELVFKAAPSCL